jgi:SNF2 family DNA or RNA helicase
MKEYRKAEADIVQYLVDRAKVIAAELGESVGSAAVRARFRAESNQHLVQLSVLRRLAAKAKMKHAEEWIESHVEEGRKVVVAAHHRDIVDEVANRYGGLKIQGGMSVKEVEAVKARFQEASAAEAPVLVLSIQAAKTGHTLTAAQEILFLEQPWTPADVSQTYSRLHRIGQQGSVTATYMLAAGTVDEDIYDLIEEKRSVVDQATEGTSGAEDGTAPGLALRIIGGLLSDEM